MRVVDPQVIFLSVLLINKYLNCFSLIEFWNMT
jgi:hypothetical protein